MFSHINIILKDNFGSPNNGSKALVNCVVKAATSKEQIDAEGVTKFISLDMGDILYIKVHGRDN